MSAAALVAYERTDGCYSLHYSHWGAAGFRLVDAVTPRTPFGGSADRDTAPARRALAGVQAGRDARGLPPVDPAATLVNPAPLRTGVARRAIPDHVDAGDTGAVYLVSLRLAVRPFLPVGGRIHRDVGGSGGGAWLVELAAPPSRDAERLRAWVAGARATLEGVVDRGAVPSETVRAVFADRLRDRAGDRAVLEP